MSRSDGGAIHDALGRAATRLGWHSAEPVHASVALCAAALAMVVETWHFLRDGSLGLRIGEIPVSPSVLPVLVVTALAGSRLVGRSRSRDSALVFWTMVAMVLAVVTAAIDRIEPMTVAGLLMAALSEELVYRLAAPLVLAYGFERIGVPHRRALTAAYVISGAAFVALPGHVVQWAHWSGAVPFIAFTLLATLAVHRTGAVLAVAILHAAMNMVNIGRMTGAVGGAGAVMLAGLLALLMVSYAAPRRPGLDDDVVIDLTGPDAVVTGGGAGAQADTHRGESAPIGADVPAAEPSGTAG